MIRNAVDHGIEDKETRARSGKPVRGHIALRALHRGDRVVIEVADDGKGLSATSLVARAKEKGLVPPDAQLGETQAYELIFLPGFSTKAQVTDISGRGVGMDVVRSNIEALNGTIEIETREGRGTTMRVSLPLARRT